MECGRVCDMSLFHTGATKHLKLEEFDSAQQQASIQVCIQFTCVTLTMCLAVGDLITCSIHTAVHLKMNFLNQYVRM